MTKMLIVWMIFVAVGC